MPFYQFRCEGCGETRDVYRTIDERKMPVSCERCGGMMARVPEAPGFVLKGDGWPGKGERKEGA